MKFIYHDGGRSAYGFKGKAGDCVIRAISIITDKPYIEVYTEFRSRGALPWEGVHRNIYGPYLEKLGYIWVSNVFLVILLKILTIRIK